MNTHACDGAPDYDGGEFIIAVCTCGWTQDGYLDIEDAIDGLMDHTWEAARSWAVEDCDRSHDD